MSRIHFIGGEKGGVGKSVVARVLAQRCLDRSIPFAAVDTDVSHASLYRHYRDFTQQADLSSTESADHIMDRALAAERDVLVDLPAQSARLLTTWLESADILQFARDMGIDLVFWHVTDGGFDSVQELERRAGQLGVGTRQIVVKNYGRAKDFSQVEESEGLRRLRESGGQVVELPELDAPTMHKIDRFGLSFWSAINTQEGHTALRPLERRRAKMWLDTCYARLDGLNGVFDVPAQQ